jgi:hypothetical protein
MKSFLSVLTLTTAMSISAWSQQPPAAPQTSPPPGNTPTEQQSNAASATQDNSGISGDQVTKPAGAKGTTLIGCLNGPDPEGKLVLTSMQHRTGVEVLGPDDLKNDLGTKVKLTGGWEASPQQQLQSKAKEQKLTRRFQVTAVEVLSQHCSVPSEKTPVSKEKQRQREAQQQQQKTGDPGATPSPN